MPIQYHLIVLGIVYCFTILMPMLAIYPVSYTHLLKKIAEICRWVPAHAPRTYWEAIQMYWFVHLGTITELNGWDAMNPGDVYKRQVHMIVKNRLLSVLIK